MNAFLSRAGQLSPRGPYALIMLEDAVEVDATIAHCQKLGFTELLVFGTPELLPADRAGLHLIAYDMHAQNALSTAVNALIKARPNVWLHYCYNAEFLHYPFCETRSVRELITFNAEERRDTMLAFVIDLYSTDLGAHPNAVSLDHAYLDREGYYALARRGDDGEFLDRQFDFYGGLRWRFEEHVPWGRRRIDRVGLFKAIPGLRLSEDHRFNIEEFNTYSCEWHHSLSATVCSFRCAKALMSNPGSMYVIPHFWWRHSEPFKWNSNQLMELGLMEPGQWF